MDFHKPGFSKKEEIEAYALIDDLRAQVKDLSKSNSGLKNKLNFFKTLHEAETRKRTPYDHIPPRVVTVRAYFIFLKRLKNNFLQISFKRSGNSN